MRQKTAGGGQLFWASTKHPHISAWQSVTARPGAKYQVLIDGRRIVDVESKGSDLSDLRIGLNR